MLPAAIFVCRYWYFDSVADIAKRFSLSENHVYVTLHRLRTQLPRHTALLVPLRRGRRPRRPALPRSLCPSVGATLAVARGRGRAPPLCTPRNAPSRADRVVRPCKIMPCRAGPMCPAVPPYPLQKARHCHSQCAHWLWQSVLLKGSPTTRCPTRKIPSGSRGFRRGFLCPISIFP